MDAWVDNHYGIDVPPYKVGNVTVSTVYLDGLLERLARGASDGAPTYRLWRQMMLDAGQLYTIYAFEPSGWAVQVDGFLQFPPSDVPQWNSSLCGQGECFNDLQI